jgi:hypothetical protein
LPSVPVAALPVNVLFTMVRSPFRLPSAPPLLAALFVNVQPLTIVSPPPNA